MTSLHQAFKNAKLKVERGDHHIREYTQTIIAFLQTDFCKVTVEEDGETGNYLVKVDATAPYPPGSPRSLEMLPIICERPLIISLSSLPASILTGSASLSGRSGAK